MTKKGTVLIVEDDLNIRSYLAEIFRGDDFMVEQAANGQEALQLLDSLDPLPDIIFLDMMMPVMDGQSFLTEIQNKSHNEHLKHIPVVILSAAMSEVSGNVVACLRKPTKIDRLCDLAEKYAGSRMKA